MVSENKESNKDEIRFNDKGDADRFLNPGTERTQSLKGFNDEYVDIVDYILRCTHFIWEEHGIGRIYDHYQHNTPIWTSDGLTYGRDAAIQGTTMTQAAFPDVRLWGDEVIWSGNDEEGFHTSHRISWTGHNTGYSAYGPPTGRKIYRFGIANCLVKENLIIEEWIARDELSLITQLGFNPWEMAAKMVKKAQKKGLSFEIEGEIERLRGQNHPEELPPPPSDGFEIEDFIRRSIHEIWNWRLLNKINDYFVSNYQFHGPAGKELYGRGSLKAFILSMLSMFPDLAATVDHVYWNGNDKDGYNVATRWTIQGTHEGPGVYGEPTGKKIRIMVISHQYVRNGMFQREWTVFDEFALLKQIYTPEIHGFFE
jgi:predicted ester cyclase